MASSSPTHVFSAIGAECSGSEARLQRPVVSKHARRLQLRNIGFRGTDLSISTSTASLSSQTPRVSAEAATYLSESENFSPSAQKLSSSPIGSPRLTTDVLQDIGKAAWKNRKQSRARTASNRTSGFRRSSIGQQRHDDSPSPPPQSTSVRHRTIRAKGRTAVHPRRSTSNDLTQYIEHLEADLAAAQAQIAAMISPSVTRKQSHRMRHLNAETQHLQEAVAEWEAKFELRVQECNEKHHAVEASLRSRIRDLEQETFASNLRTEELESRLDAANQNTDAIETANVGLEKRLEIMSELLAASPTRIDLSAETPGRPRPSRPHSMLPCFPTMSSLISLPERHIHTQPASPTSAFPRSTRPFSEPPGHLAISPDDSAFDSESIFSSDNGSATAKHADTNSAHYTKHKQTRRMRRFVAGSMGPKPLILPATTYGCGQPASASSYTGQLPFAQRCSDSQLEVTSGARQGLSETNVLQDSENADPPRELWSPIHADEDTLQQADHRYSSAEDSSPLTSPERHSSSPSPTHGNATTRNLMEELEAVNNLSDAETNKMPDPDRASDETLAASQKSRISKERDHGEVITNYDEPAASAEMSGVIKVAAAPNSDHRPSHSPVKAATDTAGDRCQSASLHGRSLSSGRVRSPFLGTPSSRSTMSRISDHFRPGSAGRPTTLARYLIQLSQSRLRLPAPLLHLQWWLIGFLLGPLARRRLLGPTSHEREAGYLASRVIDESPNDASMAYGRFRRSSSTSSRSSDSHLAVWNKVRDLARNNEVERAGSGGEVRKVWKHNPWLWLKFSVTLIFAVSCAIKDGPASLLLDEKHTGVVVDGERRRHRSDRTRTRIASS